MRDYNLVSRIAEQHEVWVLSLLEPDQDLADARKWLGDCRHVDGVRADRSVAGTLTCAVKNLLQRRPLATAPYWYPELAARIRELSQKIAFDLVQIEHSHMAPYRAALSPEFTAIPSSPCTISVYINTAACTCPAGEKNGRWRC